MSTFLGSSKVNKFGMLTEPSTYDADITPENMQRGMSAYAQGKKVTGTGKAFAVAGYGQRRLQSVFDENGKIKYGISISTKILPNTIFVAPTYEGDIVLQDEHIIELADGKVTEIGINHTTAGAINAFYNGSYLIVYLNDIQSKNTKLKYFYGKDNER